MHRATRFALVLYALGLVAVVWSALATEVQPAVLYVDENGNEIDHYRFEHDLFWSGLAAITAAVALTVLAVVARRRARADAPAVGGR